MTLPAEIRVMIYRAYLKTNNAEGKTRLSIMRTCKKVYAECSPELSRSKLFLDLSATTRPSWTNISIAEIRQYFERFETITFQDGEISSRELNAILNIFDPAQWAPAGLATFEYPNPDLRSRDPIVRVTQAVRWLEIKRNYVAVRESKCHATLHNHLDHS